MARRNLLIDEYPLIVLPSLAMAIGLNEAITVQQVHYWTQNPKGSVEIDGIRWVYNTHEEWQRDNFPFWSVRTVIRTFTGLEEMELLVAMQLASYDRKKYYRVHYANLASWIETDCHNADLQNGMIDDDNLASSPLTETTEETTSEMVQLFKTYFIRFYGKKEQTRWGAICKTVGNVQAKELARWAFKKEIHLTNRGSLLDSLETAARNWKVTPAQDNTNKVDAGIAAFLAKYQEVPSG